MKQTLTLLLVLFSGITFAQEEPTTLTCPRADKFDELLTEHAGRWCSTGKFAEGANELFKAEATAFQEEALTPALHDNTHNINWIVNKATQDNREHAHCLELACETIWNTCAGLKNFNTEKKQNNWCRTQAEEFTKLEQLKSKEVTIENSKRKNRSNYREKMRAIEVRATQYFIPLLDNFHNAFRLFTIKTGDFLSKPL